MSKKGENIYKRKDGRWEARYVKSRTQGGKTQYGYCYAKSYREAKEKLCCIKAELINGSVTTENAQKKKLAAFCDEWLTLKRGTIKDSTYVKYSTVVEKHIKPSLGGLTVACLTSLVAEQFAHDLIHKEKLAAKTAKDILVVLNSVLKYAEKQAPYLRKTEISYPKAEKKEMRVLTREEQESFTSYLLKDIDNFKFPTLFALLTGLRIGEICALHWRDVSLTDVTVCVKCTMQRIKNLNCDTGSKTKVVITSAKSYSSAREIPLSPLALELCKKFYGSTDAYILTGEADRFVEPRTLQYKMKRYTSDCGLVGVHFHTLRHSFATRCVEVGFEIKSLSEVLGHANPQITLERYVHSSIELKRENMMKLAAIGY